MILVTTSMGIKAQVRVMKGIISKLITTKIITRKIVTKKTLIDKTLNLRRKSIIVIITQTACHVMGKAKVFFHANQIRLKTYQKI